MRKGVIIGALLLTFQSACFSQILYVGNDATSTFIIGGHFYGGNDNKSGYPASTILANIDEINSKHPEYVFCTGDLYRDFKNDQEKYDRALIKKLNCPLINAVGNHDVSWSGEVSVNYQSVITAGVTHIVLDTELDNGHIEGDQFYFLKRELESAESTVFIYSHRPIWCEENEELAHLFNGNTRSGTNYQADILPLLESSGRTIYWFSGSLGGNAAASFFYHHQSEHIYYINTAIRNLPRDGLIEVNVVGGKPSFSVFSLTGKDLMALEEYDLAFWGENEGDENKFNFRLVPLYIKQMLTHRYFWYGFIYTVVGVLLLLFIRRRRIARRGV